MSDRYRIISQETFEDTFFSEFPIIPEKSRVMFDNQTNKIIVQFQFLNICDKIINTVYLNITCLDVAKEVISSDIEHILTMADAKRGDSFGEKMPLYLTDTRIAHVNFVIKKVVFQDGTIWKNKNNAVGIQLPSAQNMNIPVNCQFEEAKNYWRCSCGMLNNSEICCKCGTKKENLQMLFSEEYLKKRIAEEKEAEQKREYEREKRLSDSDFLEDVQKALSYFENLKDAELIQKCKNRIEELKAEEERKKQVKEQERQAEILKHKEKVKKLKRKIAIISGVVAFVAVAGIVSGVVYDNHQKALEQERIAEESRAVQESIEAEEARVEAVANGDYSQAEKGDTFEFGSYDGEAIEWRVLEVSSNKITVITKDCIRERAYNREDEDVTWETCTLRTWLNEIFYNNVFTDEEKSHIAEVTNSNPDNSEYGTDGGNDTTDKVYLLSLDEAETYFSSDNDRETGSWWWLRSLGYDRRDAVGVDSVGSLDTYGGSVDYDFGVRPVITLKY